MLTLVWETIDSGGWVMWPLIGLSIGIHYLALPLILGWRIHDLRLWTPAGWDAWIRGDATPPTIIRPVVDGVRSAMAQEGLQDQQERGWIAARIHRLFDLRQSGWLAPVDRRLGLLRALVAMAPLMGLLGTVAGMMLSFQGMSVGGGDAQGAVGSGIPEALITTQTGLLIAVEGLALILLAERRRSMMNHAFDLLRQHAVDAGPRIGGVQSEGTA